MSLFIPKKQEIWQRKPNFNAGLRENHWAYDRLTAAFPLTENGGEFVDLVDGVVLGAQNGAILEKNSYGDVVANAGGAAYFKTGSHKPYEPSNYITLLLGITKTGTAQSYGKILNYGQGTAAPWGAYVIEQNSTSPDSVRAYAAINGTRVLTSTNAATDIIVDIRIHLALRYDGSKVELLKNGIVLQSVNATGPMSGNYNGVNGLSVGARDDAGQYYSAIYDYLWMFHDGILDNDEIQSLYDAPYQFLKQQKTYFVLTSAANVNLSANAAANATSITSISADIPLAAASVAFSDANAVVSAQADLSGVAASITSTNNSIAAQVQITVNALANSLANAGLNLAVLMQSQAVASADGSGLLSAVGGNTELSGSGVSSAASDATISLNATLSGVAVAKALAQAAITTGQGLSAHGKASAKGSGILLVDVPIAGSAKSFVNGQGGLSAMLPVSGSAVSASNATGGLNISVSLTVDAVARALAQAGLTADQVATLGGSAISSAAGNATVNLQLPLSVSALANADAVGALSEGISNIPWSDRYSHVADARRYSKTANSRRYIVCA